MNNKKDVDWMETNQVAQSTVTSKGQITIPKMIREYLNIHTGEPLSFFYGPDDSVMIKKVEEKCEVESIGTDGGARLQEKLAAFTVDEIEREVQDQETIEWGQVGDEIL